MWVWEAGRRRSSLRNRSSKAEELCTEFNRSIREYVPADIFFTKEQLTGVPDKELNGLPMHNDGKRQVQLRVDKYLTLLRCA